MAPVSPLRRGVFASLMIAAVLLLAPRESRALRLVSWNLLDYPTTALASRQPSLRTVCAAMGADLIAIQELKTDAGRDSFLTNVLNIVEPGQWSSSNFFVSSESAVFYKHAKLTLNFQGVVTTDGPRDVLLCRFRPVGYNASSTDFRVYSVHFKAGTATPSTTDSMTRRLECTDLRASINLAATGTQFLITGDTNFYGDWEGGYIRLTESQADNDGRSKDPTPISGTWNNGAYALYHSQSPCTGGCTSGTYSTGGLDDRFDFWLTSFNLQDGEATDYLVGTSHPYGQDGLHYNAAVNGGGFNNAVGITIANALWVASDHLPVIVDLQVPAEVAAASALPFGSVITGATAQQTLTVANGATAPADELTYSLSAPAGFTAPAGTFTANAGVAGNNHTIEMSTASTGVKSGTLTVATDDPDSASKSVLLSGTVLAHASPSLDSLVSVVEDSVRFGSHQVGSFSDQDVRVHNRGWNSLKARLGVNNATITGGGGRFSIAGGFTSALLSGVGKTWSVHFDDTGAAEDTTYEATLTFTSDDEPLPGATALSALTLHLVANVLQGSVDVTPNLPTRVAFYPPRPNPSFGSMVFRFDLPREAEVSLEVFDLSGRRVASVIEGTLGAGARELRWSARRDDGGPLEAGLYFARFRGAGLLANERLIVLP